MWMNRLGERSRIDNSDARFARSGITSKGILMVGKRHDSSFELEVCIYSLWSYTLSSNLIRQCKADTTNESRKGTCMNVDQ